MGGRKLSVFFVTVVVTAVIAFFLTSLIRNATNPEAVVLRELVPEVKVESPGVFSEAHDQNIMRLYNDVGRQVNWSHEDRQWVADIIGSSWPDIPLDPTDPELDETWMLFNSTITIIGERLRYGITTDEGVARLYRETVVDLLDHPQPRLRSRGVTAIANAGMLNEQEYLLMLEAMQRTEKDESVLRSLRIKLDQHAGIPTQSDDCPTCPRGEP